MKKKIFIGIVIVIMAVFIFTLISCGGRDEESLVDPNTPIEVKYVRVVDEHEERDTVIKFNAPYFTCDYDIRVSDSEITEESFDSAKKVKFKVKGEGVAKTVTLRRVGISLENAKYVAIKPYVEESRKSVKEGDIVCFRIGGDELLPIDYNAIVNAITVHHGESLKNFGKMFDEQDVKYINTVAPETQTGKLYSNAEDVNDNGGAARTLAPIIDLEYGTYVSRASLYFKSTPSCDIKIRASREAVDFMADDSKWDKVVVLNKESITDAKWYDVALGIEAEYVQIVFVDGNAPTEVMLFGYQCGESDHPPVQTSHNLPKMNELLGMCGFVAAGGGNTSITQMSCVSVMREYHNYGWTFNPNLYPGKYTNSFSGNMGNFDTEYRRYTEAGINVIPCIQWREDSQMRTIYSLNENRGVVKRNATYGETFLPLTYQAYAHDMFIFSARYGRSNTESLAKIMSNYTYSQTVGLNRIKWLELGNEPNGEGNNGYTPYQLAALTSAAYDGHENTLVDVYGLSNHFGIKNADPTMKVAMAGLAGVGNKYISSMVYWMKANRTDSFVAMDAFNVHTYFCKEFTVNGQTVQMGVSPEEFDLVGAMSQLVELRDKYYPEKEVWLTEFGWDTVANYNTKTACHPYADYTARQVQAMWLTRAYLLLSASGVDKATMYMCEDGGSEDSLENSQYGTCGVYDVNGNRKDSYYYLYTLKNTLGEYTFAEEIDSGRSDVMIYKYVNADGKVGFAIWCPTSDGRKVENFKLYIGADGATLVENTYGETAGIKSTLTASDKIVSLTVTENPVYVMVN